MTPTSPSISRTLPGGASFPAAATGAAAATSRLAPIRQALMAPSHNYAQQIHALSFRTVTGDIITHAGMAHERFYVPLRNRSLRQHEERMARALRHVQGWLTAGSNIRA